MAKRKKGRAAKQGSIPVLVIRQFIDTEMSLRETMSVQAIALGFATPAHYHTLLDMHGVLLIASKIKPIGTENIRHYANTILGVILHNIKLRYDRTGTLGCAGQELTELKRFPSIYRDFWAAQPIELYKQSFDVLEAYYNKVISAEDAGLISPHEAAPFLQDIPMTKEQLTER